MAETADATASLQQNSTKKKRKRRHSLSSTRSLTTGTETHHLANSKSKQTDTNKTSTLDRIHHHSTFREPKTEGLKKTGRTSLLRIFKSKSAKKRLQMEAYKDMESEKPILLENKSDYVRVVTTELHPRIQYKTLPITECTTAYEVVVMIVTKFAVKDEDKDPDSFYITEEQESEQGSYSRTLENNDRLHSIQSRWTDDNKKYSFVLCRKEIPTLNERFATPISAVVLSPSQDSFYTSIPGMITVEEAGGSPSASQTESPMNRHYFQPSVRQRVVPSVKSGVCTTTGLDMINRINDRGNEAIPHGLVRRNKPHSVLPVSPSALSTSEASTIDVLSNAPHHFQTSTVNESETNYPRGDSDTQFSIPQSLQSNSNPGRITDPESDCRNGHMDLDYKKVMQQSVSEGMPGIMNKVIEEGKLSASPRMKKGQLSPLSCSSDPGMGMGLGQEIRIKSAKGESMVLRTLICSPMEAASRKFPEFVFTPGPSTKSETTTFELVAGDSDRRERRSSDAEMVLRNMTPSNVTENDNVGNFEQKAEDGAFDVPKNDTTSRSIKQREECNLQINESKVDALRSEPETQTRNKVVYPCFQIDLHTIISQAPFAHHSTTTKSVLAVSFETRLTIPFTKYHSRASLYPSFPHRNSSYSTEMDIADSLHAILDNKFNSKQQSEKQQSSNATHSLPCEATTDSEGDGAAVKSTDRPVVNSKVTKSHSICIQGSSQRKTNVSLKRPHSFHVRDTRLDHKRSDSTSSNLESPIKREILMKKAAQALKQRQIPTKQNDGGFGSSNVWSIANESLSRESGQATASSASFAKSMENLTGNHVLPGLSISHELRTQQQSGFLSSSTFSLQALPSRQVSFQEQVLSRPRRSQSFRESAKSWQSLEALHFRAAVHSEEGDEELLYTCQRRRPVTVLVRSKSTLSVNQDLGKRKAQYHQANDLDSSNLTTQKCVSSQGIADAAKASNNLNFVGKRFGLNRPISAPTARSSGSGKYGLDGLMNSMNLKADKLWWNEL